LAQTYTHWDLIVVDDGSTDATAVLVSAYCQQDARTRYMYQTNARQSRTRKYGIAFAKGEYIAFLDADDLWLSHKLAVQVPILQASSAALVYSEVYAFEDYFELSRPYRLLGATSGLFVGKVGLAKFLRYNRILTLIVVAKRNALVQVGNFVENPLIPNAEDFHLWLKLLLAGYSLQEMMC
jgi:teichuronic acid biosynthesis glycosyltransferase TuaG